MDVECRVSDLGVGTAAGLRLHEMMQEVFRAYLLYGKVWAFNNIVLEGMLIAQKMMDRTTCDYGPKVKTGLYDVQYL